MRFSFKGEFDDGHGNSFNWLKNICIICLTCNFWVEPVKTIAWETVNKYTRGEDH